MKHAALLGIAAVTAFTAEARGAGAETRPGVVDRCPGTVTRAYRTVSAPLLPRPYTVDRFPNIAVIEEDGNFVDDGDINLAHAAKAFFTAFSDDRDFLFVFASTRNEVSANYNAYYRSVRNNVRGIGRELVDYSGEYGSSGKLLGVANMNTIHKWRLFLKPLLDLWPLGVITHELGHQWVAYVRVNSGTITTDPLSSLRSHWSALTHTEASIMYGNSWSMLPSFSSTHGFVSTLFPAGFSSLDKYLMGVHGADRVREFFRINASSSRILNHFALPGNIAKGTKVKVTVNDVIAANGAREPDYRNAQRNFKAGFILIAQRGRRPTDAELNGVEYLRKRIPEHFNSATDRRFSISTTLARR